MSDVFKKVVKRAEDAHMQLIDNSLAALTLAQLTVTDVTTERLESPLLAGTGDALLEQFTREYPEAFMRYFFDKVCKGEAFCDIRILKEQFGFTMQENYGIESGPFLDLAHTYWTLRVLLDDIESARTAREKIKSPDKSVAPPEYTLNYALWRWIERNQIGPLFFPMPGVRGPTDAVREETQKAFLQNVAPQLATDEYFSQNPYLEGKWSSERQWKIIKGHDYGDFYGEEFGDVAEPAFHAISICFSVAQECLLSLCENRSEYESWYDSGLENFIAYYFSFVAINGARKTFHIPEPNRFVDACAHWLGDPGFTLQATKLISESLAWSTGFVFSDAYDNTKCEKRKKWYDIWAGMCKKAANIPSQLVDGMVYGYLAKGAGDLLGKPFDDYEIGKIVQETRTQATADLMQRLYEKLNVFFSESDEQQEYEEVWRKICFPCNLFSQEELNKLKELSGKADIPKTIFWALVHYSPYLTWRLQESTYVGLRRAIPEATEDSLIRMVFFSRHLHPSMPYGLDREECERALEDIKSLEGACRYALRDCTFDERTKSAIIQGRFVETGMKGLSADEISESIIEDYLDIEKYRIVCEAIDSILPTPVES